MASAAAAAGGGGEGRSVVDPFVWKACAGSSVCIPTVGSLVYYFPQGHAEHASAEPDLSSSVSGYKPCSLCRVAGVWLLANQETDEVYARVDLDPRISPPVSPPSPREEGDGGVLSFAKVLTPSDANNGGGFSVPRFCADSIFPPLDFNADPPVQVLSIRDVRGTVWEFRHIFRGTPRRHLLTTGWSKFVNSKRLVAGDAVVFIKKGSGELFVGVRRTRRSAGHSDFSQCSPLITPPAAAKFGDNSGEGFSRNCRGRVTPEAVVEAATLAGMGHPFGVMYYPRAGFPDFVVKKDVVESAVHARWSAGTRVKMAMETDDGSRMTSFQGTVSSIVRHPAPFTFSPWRTLEVTWDEPDVLQNLKSVSPWQVELVSVSAQILDLYPAIKKPKVTQNHEILTDGLEQNMFIEVSEISNKMMGGISPSVFHHSTFPVGIQGARHDPICVPSLSNLLPNGTCQMFSEKLNDNDSSHKASHVSSALSIGIASQSENSSPPSQNSIDYYGSELFSNLAGNTSAKVISVSFQLFGKTIQMEQPVAADVKEGCKDNDDTVRPLDVSLSYSQNQFRDGHTGQLHGVSAVKT